MTETTPLLTFYGDDFTGSTDVLESLAVNGIETVLFLEPPEPCDLEAFGDVQAVGVAGNSRTMSPTEMDEQLPPIFEALDDLGAELFHYKVCSTFDSAPEVGSIGHAIDIGMATFESPFVPVVVAAPSLRPRGRYVLFGNLFATVDDRTYRLDRHPTMSNHPVTPMTEADLRRHLGEQTDREIGLLDVHALDRKAGEELNAALDAMLDSNEIALFDGLNHDHQEKVGQLIWENTIERDETVFSASSSGLTYALSRHWDKVGLVERAPRIWSATAADQIVVMSGSASPATRDQIEWALDRGFTGVRLDTLRLVDSAEAEAAREEAIERALEPLEAGNSVVCFAACGPDDPMIKKTLEQGESLGLNDSEIHERIGVEQGKIMRQLLDETGIRRACVAGGDTSGYVAPQLEAYALEFAAPVGPGSPLCRIRSRNETFDGLEIALKGGQVQTTHSEADYFGVVQAGGTSE